MMNGTVIFLSWLLVSLFYAFQYVLRILPNLMSNEILEKFSIDAAIFGQFSGLYYVGYALGHIPVGLLIDRLGAKKVVPICVLVATLGVMPLVFTSNWILACLGRVVLGLGSSGAVLGMFKVIRQCYSEKNFTRMLGFSVTIGLSGAIFAGGPVAYLMSLMGWEAVVELCVLMGLALATSMYVLLPKRRADEEEASHHATLFEDLKIVFGNKKVLILCILAGLMVGPLEGFADVWGTAFIKAAYDVSESVAQTAPSMIFWGMLVGCPLIADFCNRFGRYFETVIFSAVMMAVGFIALLSSVLSTPMVFVSLFVVGFFCAYQIPALSKISSFVPERLTSLAGACINMVIMIFGYLFHSGIGHILANANVSSTQASGLEVFSYLDFVQALSLIPIGLVIAAIGFMVVLTFEYRQASIEAKEEKASLKEAIA